VEALCRTTIAKPRRRAEANACWLVLARPAMKTNADKKEGSASPLRGPDARKNSSTPVPQSLLLLFGILQVLFNEGLINYCAFARAFFFVRTYESAIKDAFNRFAPQYGLYAKINK